MEDDLIWKALSDSTRREILDLLRKKPMRTSDLVAHFEMSRFGVMSHLSILIDCGLVIVEKSGREKWHSINSVPIRDIYRRWIKPFEEDRADRLLKLKEFVEKKGEGRE